VDDVSESLRPSRRYEQTPDDHTLCTGPDGCGSLVRDRQAHERFHDGLDRLTRVHVLTEEESRAAQAERIRRSFPTGEEEG
jgi:hypothetical protein